MSCAVSRTSCYSTSGPTHMSQLLKDKSGIYTACHDIPSRLMQRQHSKTCIVDVSEYWLSRFVKISTETTPMAVILNILRIASHQSFYYKTQFQHGKVKNLFFSPRNVFLHYSQDLSVHPADHQFSLVESAPQIGKHWYGVYSKHISEISQIILLN